MLYAQLEPATIHNLIHSLFPLGKQAVMQQQICSMITVANKVVTSLLFQPRSLSPHGLSPGGVRQDHGHELLQTLQYFLCIEFPLKTTRLFVLHPHWQVAISACAKQ